MESKEVRIACKGSHMVNIHEIELIQKDLKDLSQTNYEKLRGSILKFGFVAPLFIWNKKCLDGTQRIRTLLKMETEGYDLPALFPAVDIKAEDEKAAKRVILSVSSQYGKISDQSLYEYISDIDLSFEELDSTFDFSDIDFDKFEKNYFLDEVPKEGKEIDLDELADGLIECPSCSFKFPKK